MLFYDALRNYLAGEDTRPIIPCATRLSSAVCFIADWLGWKVANTSMETDGNKLVVRFKLTARYMPRKKYRARS